VGSVDAGRCLSRVDVVGRRGDDLVQTALGTWDEAAGALDPDAGVVLRAVWLDAGPEQPGRLLLAVHHLATDGVSWRVLLPDLAAGWVAAHAGATPELPPVGTSFRRWSELLHDESRAPARAAELGFWEDQLSTDDIPPLGARPIDPATDVVATEHELTVKLPAESTQLLLTRVPARYQATMDEVLLAALAAAFDRPVLVELEGHGREEVVGNADLSRTVGWFTTVYPVRLDTGGFDRADALSGGPAAGQIIKRVKEQLHAIPDKGVGYGLLRYLNPPTAAAFAGLSRPQLGFNYLGRFAAADLEQAAHTRIPEWTVLGAAAGIGGVDPDQALAHVLELNARTNDRPAGPELSATWTWAGELLPERRVRELADLWFRALRAFVAHARRPDAGGLTPSDVSLSALDQSEIERLEAEWRDMT
jgi:non-ribosomal peptide synthase protein (TIGR01720 family)